MPSVTFKDTEGGRLTVSSEDIRAVHRLSAQYAPDDLVRVFVVGYGWAVVHEDEEGRARQLLDDREGNVVSNGGGKP